MIVGDTWVNVDMDMAVGIEGDGGEAQVVLLIAVILIVEEVGEERRAMNPLMTHMVVADIIEGEEAKAVDPAETIEGGGDRGLDPDQGQDRGIDPVVMTAKIGEDRVVANLIEGHVVDETEMVAIADYRGEGRDREVVVGVMIGRRNVVHHHRLRFIVMEDLPVGTVITPEASAHLMTGRVVIIGSQTVKGA